MTFILRLSFVYFTYICSIFGKFEVIIMIYSSISQVDLSICGKDFKFTLIARRSRHYAGTRFEHSLLVFYIVNFVVL